MTSMISTFKSARNLPSTGKQQHSTVRLELQFLSHDKQQYNERLVSLGMTAAVPVNQVEGRKRRAQPSAVATVQQAEMAATAPSAVTAVQAQSAVMAVPAAKSKVQGVHATISAAAAAPVVKVNAPEAISSMPPLFRRTCSPDAGHRRQRQSYFLAAAMTFTDPSLQKSHQAFNRSLSSA